MRTRFTAQLGVVAPLVGFSRSPGVVVGVSRAGGLGVLAATAYSPPELDAQLTWIESQLDGRPYGVDVLVPSAVSRTDSTDLLAGLRAQIPPEHHAFVRDLLRRYEIPATTDDAVFRDEIMASINVEGAEALIEVAFSHRIALIANALGTPPPSLVARAKAAGVVVAALVGEAKHALRQLEEGVDLLIAQGTEAGGHTGTVATMILTPEIVDLAGDTPVLAAGGIGTGRQLAAALALGADGAWCGSVWLSSVEDITPLPIKEKLIAARSVDTVRSKARTGKYARQLRSAWHDEWEKPLSPETLPMPLQPMLVNDAWNRIDAAAEHGHEGALRLESFFVGQVVGAFTQLRPAQEIAETMISDCERRIRAVAQLISVEHGAQR